MARIKYFEDRKIAIYIYGEKTGKHHGKHVLVLKSDEDCQYGFDGEPLNCSAALKNRADRTMVREWILAHQTELEQAWEDINNGIDPGMIG